MQDEEYRQAEKLKQGDRRAFEGFYQETRKELFLYIVGKVSVRADAQELTHDTYLSFLDSLPLFAGKCGLKTYLFSIARHEVADYFRKKYAKKVILTVPFMDHLYTEKLYSNALLNDEIERIYARLSSDYVVILKLRFEDGMRVVEIASRLQLSFKATESRLLRARRAFQKAYLKLYG
jgi:RNA polymerase sigma-70 factor (ECF subfamily)